VLHIFDRLLLVVAFGIPVMTTANRLFEASVTVHSSVIVEILTTASGYPNHIQGQRVRSCVHVRPKQCEVCFTVSDVGGWSPIHNGGAPLIRSHSS